MTNYKSRITFYKFNAEQKKLGVNVFDIDELRPSLNEGPVFREACITTYFICGGQERLTVNGHTREVNSGDVICTLPQIFFVTTASSTVSDTYVRID